MQSRSFRRKMSEEPSASDAGGAREYESFGDMALDELCTSEEMLPVIVKHEKHMENLDVPLWVARRAKLQGCHLFLWNAVFRGEASDDEPKSYSIVETLSYAVMMQEIDFEAMLTSFRAALSCATEAARQGKTEIFSQAVERMLEFDDDATGVGHHLKHGLSIAVSSGHIDVLRVLESSPIPASAWPDTGDLYYALENAASAGNLRAVKLIASEQNFCIFGGYPGFSSSAVDAAAANGHIRVVEFLCGLEDYPSGSYCGEDALRGAVSNGRLDVVRFLRSDRFDKVSSERCVWGRGLVAKAVKRGDYAMVRLLRSDEIAGPDGEKAPWSIHAMSCALKRRDFDMIRLLRSEALAGPGGERCPWHYTHMETAIRRGDAELIKFLRSEELAGSGGARCPWHMTHLELAAARGDVDLLKYMCSGEDRLPWRGCVIGAAAEAGKIDVLRFLASEEGTRLSAGPRVWRWFSVGDYAFYEHLDVVAFVFTETPVVEKPDKDLLFDIWRVAIQAAIHGHAEVVTYLLDLVEIRAPAYREELREEVAKAAIEEGMSSVYRYARMCKRVNRK